VPKSETKLGTFICACHKENSTYFRHNYSGYFVEICRDKLKLLWFKHTLPGTCMPAGQGVKVGSQWDVILFYVVQILMLKFVLEKSNYTTSGTKVGSHLTPLGEVNKQSGTALGREQGRRPAG
jgi:hypothetical protein